MPPEQRERFFGYLRAPIPLRYACALAGLVRKTVYDWIDRGSAPDATEVYRTFALEVAAAQDIGIGELAETMRLHAAQDYRAGSWYLSRMAPDAFGDPGKRQTADIDRRMAEAGLREAEAKAQMAEAKAAAVAKLAGTGQGAFFLGLEELLDADDVSPALKAELERVLAAREARVLVAKDLSEES